jgi:uncharacterized protein YndB with AHSA1/START domain
MASSFRREEAIIMGTKGTKTTGSNALRGGRPLEARVEITTPADPDAVYATLADLPTHLEWAGNRASKTARMLTMDAPEGEAKVGTEFSSTGADPMGAFADQSVVTEAVPGRIFEFVTEARQTPKRGGEPVEWTLVHRYEIASQGGGSRISYGVRITRISRLPGMLKLFGTRFAWVGMRMSSSIAKRSLRNISAVARERTK